MPTQKSAQPKTPDRIRSDSFWVAILWCLEFMSATFCVFIIGIAFAFDWHFSNFSHSFLLMLLSLKRDQSITSSTSRSLSNTTCPVALCALFPQASCTLSQRFIHGIPHGCAMFYGRSGWSVWALSAHSIWSFSPYAFSLPAPPVLFIFGSNRICARYVTSLQL